MAVCIWLQIASLDIKYQKIIENKKSCFFLLVVGGILELQWHSAFEL